MDRTLKTAWFVLAVIGSALVGGCSLVATASPQDVLPNGPLETSVVATVNALNSATPVPAITLPPVTPNPETPSSSKPLVSRTPSIIATPTPIWGDFPAPTQLSATDIPRPMPEIAFGEDVVNILLLGSDKRPNSGGFRTDAIMVVSIDPSEGTATLISIPRDLYVYIPGWRMDRINTAIVRGGIDMAKQAIRYNFGIPVDGWARMNFDGFISAIDTLGGITVEATAFMRDECRGDLLTYQPGSSYNMDGGEALCYVRMRKWGGDFDRMRRQQEVVSAVFSKLLTINGLARIPQLYNQFYTTFFTDIELTELLPLIPTAVKIGTDPTRIRYFRVDRDLVNSWRTPSGGAVLLPKRAGIQLMLMQAFGSDAFSSVE
jgi:LCP family protein required for cell wall assembly